MKGQMVRNFHRRTANIRRRKLFHSFKKWLSGYYKRRNYYRFRRYRSHRPSKEQLDKELNLYHRENQESNTDEKMNETENEKEKN